MSNHSYSHSMRRSSSQSSSASSSVSLNTHANHDVLPPHLNHALSFGSSVHGHGAPTHSSAVLLDSLAHLARRTARAIYNPLQAASSSSHTSLGSPSPARDCASSADYLPLYNGPAHASGHACNGKHKQRMSTECDYEEVTAEKTSHDGCAACAASHEGSTKRRRQSSATRHASSPSSNRCSVASTIGCLVKLAILVLALFGLAAIVGFATGNVQRTPILSEKALQDAGWTRRPISVSYADSSGSARYSQQSHRQQEQTPLQSHYTGVTIHDFSRQQPADPAQQALSSSSSSIRSSSGTSLSLANTESVPSDALHLLILCPMRNSAADLSHLFELLDSLAHPRQNTSLGFLIGDEDDDTGDVLHRLVEERMAPKIGGADGEQALEPWRHVSLLHKDFGVAPAGANRHSYPVQLQRRTVMARARTYLLTSTLEPTVDWVLWLDSDIAEVSPTLFQDLLVYGNAGVIGSASSPSHNGDAVWNDVIVPNAMRRQPDGQLHGFDMNNWAETPESLKLREQLGPDDLLIEGNIWQHMHRVHLADQYKPYTEYMHDQSHVNQPRRKQLDDDDASADGFTAASAVQIPLNGPEIFSSSPSYLASLPASDQRLNTSSPAYIGRIQPLDGIGGVAALVRAEVHRMGATFPSWIFENQLETEAFGVLAKRLGARVVGLPNLFVLHSN